jgi:EAL domain-containing protein (putative c-di-GMP-specific phosphodiesterase class I)
VVSVEAPESSVVALIGRGELRAMYQPIVELGSDEVVGYEALARGPAGSAFESPAALFAAADREGIVPQLDRACRRQALAGAIQAGLDPSLLIFLNVEPAALDNEGVLNRLEEQAIDPSSIVVELTERALTSRPREVLAAVRWLRGRGCRIALDDVGVDERSLALMPFVAPDVIKLDIAVVQDRLPALESARVLHAVGAEAERSGAVIVAEGIETEQHRRRASAIGATLGQGWYFGRPAALPPTRPPSKGIEIPARYPAEADRTTPFETIAPERALRRGDKGLLLAISRQLELEAFGLAREAVILAAFQHVNFFTARTARRYRRLAEQAALVGAFGTGMPSQPGGRVRGANLAAHDPLRDEWDVIVVAPHFAAAFVARDLGDNGPDLERRFEYTVTYDRNLVTNAARRLLSRIVPTR